ncbi:MAG: 2'-5' RNA ligase family protein [Patescibacteria group bacterium]
MEKRESILLIPVLSVEFLVKQLRDKYDPSSLRGIPPHITVLFPFKHPDEIIGEDINKLKEIFSVTEEFLFVLQSINTFPGVVFLQPSEREKFTSLTEKIVEAFPEYPPYDGRFTEINPHLTIGHELGERFDEASEITKKEIKNKLPIKTKAQEVWLMESENGVWKVKEKFPLLL